MDGQGFVIMTNSDNGSRLAGEIALSIAAAYHWPDKPRERSAIRLTAPQLEKFAGDYQLPTVGKVHVRVAGDHLAITLEDQELDWYAESPTKMFTVSGGLPDISFKGDDTGTVTGFDVAGLHASRLAR
jgi:hypothetical protein